MAMTINTNIASIAAQRHLNESRKDLDLAMERLSSGQRINSAKDDAAGLAIRDKMSSQIVGLNQSIRNANDAISLAQTAEGAMEESVSILQRMRVLAMQAVNDTNTDSDRANLNDEFNQLQLELTRIGITASFNNVKLLDGTFKGSTFQVGPGASETIFLKISDQKANAIGTTYEVANFDIFAADSPAKGDSLTLTIRGADGAGGDLTVNYTTAKAESAIQTASGMVLALNSNSTFTESYQALSDANNSVLIRRTDGTSMGLPIRAQFDLTQAKQNDTVKVTVDGVATGGAAKTFTYTSTADQTAAQVATGVAAELNDDSNGFGRFYKAYASADGKVEVRAKDGTKVDTSKITVDQVIAVTIASTYSSTAVQFAIPSTASASGDTASVTIDGQVFTTADLSTNASADAAGKIALGNAFQALTIPGWTITDDDAGKVTFTKNANYVKGDTGSGADGQSAIGTDLNVALTVTHSGAGRYSATKTDSAAGVVGATAGTNAKIINEQTGFEVTVASALNNASGELSVSSVVKAVDVFVDDIGVLSASAAMQSVRVVDDAIAMIGRERAGLGAFQNRLEHAMNNMANNSQNTQSARSVIADADYAKEAANLAKNQILQQAGTAMLAQANSQSEMVLSLLK